MSEDLYARVPETLRFVNPETLLDKNELHMTEAFVESPIVDSDMAADVSESKREDKNNKVSDDALTGGGTVPNSSVAPSSFNNSRGNKPPKPKPEIGKEDFFRSRRGRMVMISAAVLIVAGCLVGVWLTMSNKVETAVACEFEVESFVKVAVPELADIQGVTVPEKDGYVKVSKDYPTRIEILLDKKYLDQECGGSVERYWDYISATAVTVEWGPEGQPMYTEDFQLKDLDASGEILRALEKAYKDGVDKKTVPVVTVNVIPAAYNAFMEFKEKQVDQDLILNYYNDAHGLYVKYPILKNILSEICWAQVDKYDARSLKEYMDGLNSSPLSEAHRTEAQRLLEDLPAVASAIEHAAGQVEFKNMIARLHVKNCTMETVNSVKAWYNGLSPEGRAMAKDIPAYIEAYTTFFEATSSNDIKYLNGKRRYFSGYQDNIIFEGYGSGNSTFYDWYKLFGMSFSKPLDYGVVAPDGKRMDNNYKDARW